MQYRITRLLVKSLFLNGISKCKYPLKAVMETDHPAIFINYFTRSKNEAICVSSDGFRLSIQGCR